MRVNAGIRVAHVGSFSVRYEVGIFPADSSLPRAAKGDLIHVYVDPATRKPCVLPTALTSFLETLK